MNEIGQIRSDWAHIDSPWIPASSFRLPGGFGPIFPKNREKIKLEFSEKSRFSGFSGEIPKQTARPHMSKNKNWVGGFVEQQLGCALKEFFFIFSEISNGHN